MNSSYDEIKLIIEEIEAILKRLDKTNFSDSERSRKLKYCLITRARLLVDKAYSINNQMQLNSRLVSLPVNLTSLDASLEFYERDPLFIIKSLSI